MDCAGTLNTLDYYGCFSRLWVSRCCWVTMCLSVNCLRLYLCTMPPVPMPLRPMPSLLQGHAKELHPNKQRLSKAQSLACFFRTMNPRNFPDDTPKKHFRGFIFRLCCLSLRKTCRKSAKWSSESISGGDRCFITTRKSRNYGS